MTETTLAPGGKPAPTAYTATDRDRFYAWESGYRVRPEAYRTEAETAALGLDKVSAERADYFLALLADPGAIDGRIA